MKTLKTIIAVSAALILTAACAKIEGDKSDEISVTYSVTVPTTKAFGQGEAINKVWYALYRTDGSLVKSYDPVPFTGGSANCSVVMMRGQSYKIAFVAQHYDGTQATYAIDDQKKTLSLAADPIANSDNYELYAGCKEVTEYQGGIPTDAVVLARKVAQVTFTCSDTDWTNAEELDMTPTHSSISLTEIYSHYDFFNEVPCGEAANLVFSKEEIVSSTDKTLASVFVLGCPGNTQATLNLYKGEDLIRTLAVDEVSVKSNYKTNISGNIMTGSIDYTITIDSAIATE